MKIKHYQGYGVVNAKKVSADADTLVVRVSGEHEYGLVRDDKYDVFNWLVKRFDKKHTSYMDIVDIDIDDTYVENPKCYTGYEEVCTYTIHFR